MAAIPIPQIPILPELDEFNSISLIEIGHRFKYDVDATIAWCRRYGLLAFSMSCPRCNAICQQQPRDSSIDRVCWRCPERNCRKVINIRHGSFFSGSHLQLWQIIGLTYIWSTGAGKARSLSQNLIMKELCMSEHTVVDWKQFCRDICVQYFINHPELIGGPGVIVELDESLFSRRKNNVGRVRPERWVFGGYEQGRKKGFLVEVERRDAATLLPIIHQWVAPGTTIWTDRWAAYNQIQNRGFDHGTVNHQRHFVDPATGVCTNRVESMWSRAKAQMKAQQGPTNPELIPEYLAEYMWSERFGVSPFYNLWHQIANDIYVVN
ncbi:uncharacterized protein [Antedon mediterranea]|uniref:uncharacterized protein n=1 Tax=Antedon mediterranea TaxID=105859 RepID=UPI003AF83176